jgi:predicted O-methyltransferase YrrM
MPEQQSDIDKRRLGGFEDTTIDTVRSYLSGFYNVQLYEGIVQEQSSNVNDCRFSMVHIDVDIYAPYVYCLEFFSDRLVRGGIIVLDDYGFLTCPGAKRAADEFMLSRGRDFRMIHLLTGQAVIVKI